MCRNLGSASSTIKSSCLHLGPEHPLPDYYYFDDSGLAIIIVKSALRGERQTEPIGQTMTSLRELTGKSPLAKEATALGKRNLEQREDCGHSEEHQHHLGDYWCPAAGVAGLGKRSCSVSSIRSNTIASFIAAGKRAPATPRSSKGSAAAPESATVSSAATHEHSAACFTCEMERTPARGLSRWKRRHRRQANGIPVPG